MIAVTRMLSCASLVRPPLLQPGDKVAILPPSWAGPGGIPSCAGSEPATVARHLRLEPVEYLTTRKIGATPRERAAAIQANFVDPEIAATMASIGGSDLRAETHLLAPEVCAGRILLFETSEEMPYSEYVNRVLMGMGERGLIERFAAVAVATPKARDDPQIVIRTAGR
jgi:muramoyltetrapeptide carboxypeptidase LdcA involved in peptidoglycan recycling